MPTLAHQLADQLHDYVPLLAAELRKDFNPAAESVCDHVQRLVRNPLRGLLSRNYRIVFVIDALDECSDKDQLAELVEAFARIQNRTLKVLVTARPVQQIRKSTIWGLSRAKLLQLHTTDPEVSDDIRLFIRETFDDSPKARLYAEDDLDFLVTLSGGLFAFAATATAYILNSRDVSERLRNLKEDHACCVRTELDQMYTDEFVQASGLIELEATKLDAVRRIVGIMSKHEPLLVNTLAGLLGLSTKQLREALDEVHAVIFVPEQDEDDELRILHPTLVDFFIPRAIYIPVCILILSHTFKLRYLTCNVVVTSAGRQFGYDSEACITLPTSEFNQRTAICSRRRTITIAVSVSAATAAAAVGIANTTAYTVPATVAGADASNTNANPAADAKK